MVRAVGRRVWGFAEGVACQVIAIVAGYALAVAISDVTPGPWPTWATIVALTPWVIGCAVPVYRHGRWGVAGVVAGWFGVTRAIGIVAGDNPDMYQALGYFSIVWFLVILPVEALAVGAALIAKNRHAVAGAVNEGQRRASASNGPAGSTGWQSAQMSAAKRRVPTEDGPG